MSARVHVVGAASSAGAHGPGQEHAPAAFRRHGLLERLAQEGVQVVDHGDVVHHRMRPDPGRPALGSVEQVLDAAVKVAEAVRPLLEADPEDRILVLGGDCTLQLGVVAGARAAMGDAVGLAYIDLDCDLTSPTDGNGIADWMGVTHLLDAPDADARLAGIDGRPPLLTADTLRLVASDLATPYEQQRLDALALIRYPSAQVDENVLDIVHELGSWADDLTLLSVHVDVDVLDQTRFPIAEERRDNPGLSLESLTRLVSGLMSHRTARILTICEVNPDRPADPAVAFTALIGMITAAFVEPGATPAV